MKRGWGAREKRGRGGGREGSVAEYKGEGVRGEEWGRQDWHTSRKCLSPQQEPTSPSPIRIKQLQRGCYRGIILSRGHHHPPLFPALPIPLTYPSLEKATDTKEVCKFTSLTPFALQRDPLTEDPLSRLSHTGYKTVWISAGKCRSVQIVYRLCLNMYHTCFWVEQRLIDSLSLSCRFFESRSHSQTYIYIISGMVGQVPII